VLYDGQGRFHGTTGATVEYVVRQSSDTVSNLRGFTGFLQTAKAAGVGPLTLPVDVKGRIDDVVRKVSAASDELAARTSSNAARIRAVLETVYVTFSLSLFTYHVVPYNKIYILLLFHCRRKVLIVVAAALLILASLGLGTPNISLLPVLLSYTRRNLNK
jgi:hypothetical protein